MCLDVYLNELYQSTGLFVLVGRYEGADPFILILMILIRAVDPLNFLADPAAFLNADPGAALQNCGVTF